MPTINPWLFGMHDYSEDWVRIVRDAGKSAWCLHTTAIGHNPNDHNGADFRHDNTVAVVRLNNAYGSGGSIPSPDKYGDFAKRCANFIAASQGVEWVVHSNEPAMEWDAPDGKIPSLDQYMDCYLQCYDAIKAVAPHVQIAPAAPAPWNVNMPGAPDWIEQLAQFLRIAGKKADWICLHAYTRGYEQHTFHTGNKMDPPWQMYHSGWEALWDYMNVIPASHRHLPILLGEGNGDHSWPDRNTGWINHLYGVIGAWNDNPTHQKILGACLFRWAPHDEKWDISRHGASVDMWREALKHNHVHNYVPGQGPTVLKSGTVRVTADAGLNLRSEPDTNAEIVMILHYGAELKLVSTIGNWCEVEYQGQHGFVFKDYVA